MPHADGSSAWGIFYACSLLLWQDVFNFSVWTWDNVYAEQFANALRSSSTSVSRSLDSADIAADHNSDEPAADKFLTDEGNVCSLYHGICCFNGAYQTFGFDHTECFILSQVDFLLNFAFYF